MTFLRRGFATAAVALCFMTAPAAAQDFKVIVNSANGVTELSAAVTLKIFLKRSGSSSCFRERSCRQP